MSEFGVREALWIPSKVKGFKNLGEWVCEVLVGRDSTGGHWNCQRWVFLELLFCKGSSVQVLVTSRSFGSHVCVRMCVTERGRERPLLCTRFGCLTCSSGPLSSESKPVPPETGQDRFELVLRLQGETENQQEMRPTAPRIQVISDMPGSLYGCPNGVPKPFPTVLLKHCSLGLGESWDKLHTQAWAGVLNSAQSTPGGQHGGAGDGSSRYNPKSLHLPGLKERWILKTFSPS